MYCKIFIRQGCLYSNKNLTLSNIYKHVKSVLKLQYIQFHYSSCLLSPYIIFLCNSHTDYPNASAHNKQLDELFSAFINTTNRYMAYVVSLRKLTNPIKMFHSKNYSTNFSQLIQISPNTCIPP